MSRADEIHCPAPWCRKPFGQWVIGIWRLDMEDFGSLLFCSPECLNASTYLMAYFAEQTFVPERIDS